MKVITNYKSIIKSGKKIISYEFLYRVSERGVGMAGVKH